jgi:HEAT repeat protein
MKARRKVICFTCVLLGLGAASRAAVLASAETIAALTDRLRVLDPEARTEAALDLLRLGSHGEATFSALVERLADDAALDCRVAARVLYARARPATDVPALLEGLAQDTKTRAAAAWGLSRVGLPAGDEATRALLAALRHPDKHERNFIVVALATTALPNRRVIDALEDVLRDEGSPASPQTNYRYPRESAAVALEWLKASRRPASAGDDVRALVATLANTPGRIDLGIVEGLRALGAFAGAARPVAKKGTRKTAPPVHESIALALGYLDSLPRPPTPAEMATAVRNEPTGGLPAEIRRYVMALGGVQQGIASTLREAWAQAQRDPRVQAVRQLAAIGPAAREAIPALRAALDDADWIIRREAFLALQRIAGNPANPSVKEDR